MPFTFYFIFNYPININNVHRNLSKLCTGISHNAAQSIIKFVEQYLTKQDDKKIKIKSKTKKTGNARPIFTPREYQENTHPLHPSKLSNFIHSTPPQLHKTPNQHL